MDYPNGQIGQCIGSLIGAHGALRCPTLYFGYTVAYMISLSSLNWADLGPHSAYGLLICITSLICHP